MSFKPILETPCGRLYEADCLKVLASLESESVELVFADPPFNLGKLYSSGIDDSVAEGNYLNWCREWIDECIRILQPGGSFFLYNLPKWNLLLGHHIANSLTFRHWITVDIKFSLPIAGRLYPSHYSLLYFVKGKKPKIFHPDRVPTPCCRHCGGELRDYGGYKDKMNPKGVNLSDVWSDVPPVRHKRYKNRNANELSLKLMDRILSIASEEGSVVFDPFGGAGTSYVAAELTGRRWLGTELDCADILDRFDDLDTDRRYLRQLQLNKNVLFTQADLERRKKSGLPLSPNYRIPENGSPGANANFQSRIDRTPTRNESRHFLNHESKHWKLFKSRGKTKLMSRILIAFLASLVIASGAMAQVQDQGEHIVVTGGPSLMEWEKYKVQPHDNWWMNFVRASRLRIEQLRQQYGPSAQITWLVYQRGYERRQSQERESLFDIIRSVRDKYGLKLIYFNTADQLCYYLNYGANRGSNKIASFDYFGHSNRACFMLDYSNEIGSGSKVWLHQNELKDKLHHGIFARNAHVQSWGCYTAESMSKMWYAATGAKMIGAVGKTQYMTNELPVLVSATGKWSTGY